MTSHPGAPWPSHGQHPDSHSSPGNHAYAHHASPPYPHQHHAPYYPHAPPPHHDRPSPSPSAHPQHPPYPYQSYGSAPYPSYPPPAHPYAPGQGHSAQQGYGQHSNNVGSGGPVINGNGSLPPAVETTPWPSTKAKAAAATPKTPKAKAGPKTKGSKQDSQSSSETGKSSRAKTPMTFRFEGSISSESFKTTKSFDLAGVNILNRKPLDTKTALDKLQRRRETHNRVERKRRDCINQLIDDLTKLLPPKHLEEATSKCHRVNVLRGAVNHIKFLNESNQVLSSSIQTIQGDDAPLPAGHEKTMADFANNNAANREMSIDVDEDDRVKEEDMDDDSGLSQRSDSSSRSASPAGSNQSTPSISTKVSSSTSTKKMVPPPVIITDAPSPSTDRDPALKATASADPFSLDSRPRSNSFASSNGDQASPGSVFASSPMFPPSPISPLPYARHSHFPLGEDIVDGRAGSERDQRQQLSPFLSHSSLTSPSLPPISSLANLHLKSPSGHLNESATEKQVIPSMDSSQGPLFSGRSHRTGTSLPPLMIPEPHHLHPSYQQGGAMGSGARSGTSSNRSSLTLSPRSAEHPPISPLMLSPMLSRSPSMGPFSASSPGNSPHPNWGHDGTTSPQPYAYHGFASPHAHPYGHSHSGQSDYGHPSAYHYQQQQQQQRPASPSQNYTRPKLSHPESIFIQEEPWNVQRKRSTSSASGRVSSRSSMQDKKKAEDFMEVNGPTSPTSSVTSSMSYPASPNPKKRMQLASYDNEEDEGEEAVKRSKQVERQYEHGAVVAVEKLESEIKSSQKDEDAAQALTSLAQNAA
ncbi:hypothetical protein BGZ58_000035 [Dissophora ornata]|nr:hypothetical protein BGZ58_000035 [Dissophora ornata]